MKTRWHLPSFICRSCWFPPRKELRDLHHHCGLLEMDRGVSCGARCVTYALDATSVPPPPPVVTSKTVYRHCQIYPREQSCPWLKTTILEGNQRLKLVEQPGTGISLGINQLLLKKQYERLAIKCHCPLFLGT